MACSSPRPAGYSYGKTILRLGLLAFGLLTVLAGPATGDPLVISDDFIFSKLTRHTEIIADPSRELSVLDLVEMDGDSLAGGNSFGPLRGYFRLGEDTDSAFWLRFTVTNEKTVGVSLHLVLENTGVDSVQVYCPATNGTEAIGMAGMGVPRSRWSTHYAMPVFPVLISPQTSQTYYLRVINEFPGFLRLRLWDPLTFSRGAVLENCVAGLFLGSMLLMLFYNLFLFFSLRSPDHLYFVPFGCCLALFVLISSGLGFKFLWPNHPEWNAVAPFVVSPAITLFYVQFNRSFFATRKQVPRLDLVLKAFLLLGMPIIVMGLMVRTPLSVGILVAWNMVGMVFTSFICFFFLLVRKYRLARFLVLGVALAVGFEVGKGYLSSSVTPTSPLNMQFWANYLMPWTLAMMFSFALADKVNQIRREMGQARENALADLEATNRLKDDILANTSHELLTPVHGIVGISEGLLGDRAGPLNTRQSKGLAMIQQSGRRLVHLIGDILDLSRIRQDKLELRLAPVDLNMLVPDVLAVCEPLVGQKPLRLDLDLDPDLPSVMADADRLQQILLNLIGNAIKFTETGEVRVRLEQVDGHVRISVSDTGPGIPQDQHETIFDSFQQGDGSISRRFGGTGLGLAITRSLVELHGGKILVESGPERGTTFRFDLAVASAATDAQASGDLAKDQAGDARPTAHELDSGESLTEMASLVQFAGDPEEINGRRTILVVDDEPVNLHLLTELLQDEDFQVVTAQGGPQALQYLAEEMPDLVVLDLMMPGMGGYEVCQKIRESDDAAVLPILILTVRQQEADVVGAFSCGANDYLTKPFRREELLARVNGLIRIKELADTRQEKESLQEEVVRSYQIAQRMTSLIEAGDAAIITVARDQRVTFMNQQAEAIFGTSLAKTPELKISAGITPETLRQLEITEECFDQERDSCPQGQSCRIQVRSADGTEHEYEARTSLIQGDKEKLRALNLYPVRSAEVGPDKSQVTVKIMRLALGCWEELTGKDKIDLAQESRMWSVYWGKSAPTTRTLDKYLKQETLPRRPRYARVLKTGDFVLGQGEKTKSPQVGALAEAVQTLRCFLGEG